MAINVPKFLLGLTVNGARLWNPSLLTSAPATAWWDATTGVTMTGASVTTWTDKIASIALTQATGTAKPNFSATSMNGFPGIAGDGVDDVLSISSVSSALPSMTTPGWIFGLINQLRAASTNSTDRMFSYGGTTGGTTRQLLRTVSGGNNVFRNSDATAQTGPATDLSGVRTVLGRFGISTLDGRVDGVDGTQASASSNTGTSKTAMFATNAASSSAFSNVVISHLIVGLGTLSLSDIQKLEAWALWSVGKQSNLPPGHPYANSPPLA